MLALAAGEEYDYPPDLITQLTIGALAERYGMLPSQVLAHATAYDIQTATLRGQYDDAQATIRSLGGGAGSR